SGKPTEPVGVSLAELRLQFASNPLGECRTLPRSGDRDLQVSTPYHRRVVEITTLGLIDCVAQHATRSCFPEDGFVNTGIACSGHHEHYLVEIRGPKLAL